METDVLSQEPKQSEHSKTPPVEEEHLTVFDHDEEQDLKHSNKPLSKAKNPVFSKTKKRQSSEKAVGGKRSVLQKRLQKIGGNINKALTEKRKNMEMYVKDAVSKSHKNLEKLWESRQNEMSKFTSEYSQKFTTMFQQWDIDIKKLEEKEDEIADMFCQQHKNMQQSRFLQSYRLKKLNQANVLFLKSLEDLEKNNKNVLTDIQNEVKTQMTLLQKKIAGS